LFFIDGGTHIDRFIQTWPDFDFFRGLNEAIEQRVLHFRMRDDARRRRAALSSRAKSAAVNGNRGFVQIGVRHDDDGVLPAHFAGYLGSA
jgi:hypothetical protein